MRDVDQIGRQFRRAANVVEIKGGLDGVESNARILPNLSLSGSASRMRDTTPESFAHRQVRAKLVFPSSMTRRISLSGRASVYRTALSSFAPCSVSSGVHGICKTNNASRMRAESMTTKSPKLRPGAFGPLFFFS